MFRTFSNSSLTSNHNNSSFRQSRSRTSSQTNELLDQHLFDNSSNQVQVTARKAENTVEGRGDQIIGSIIVNPNLCVQRNSSSEKGGAQGGEEERLADSFTTTSDINLSIQVHEYTQREIRLCLRRLDSTSEHHHHHHHHIFSHDRRRPFQLQLYCKKIGEWLNCTFHSKNLGADLLTYEDEIKRRLFLIAVSFHPGLFKNVAWAMEGWEQKQYTAIPTSVSTTQASGAGENTLTHNKSWLALPIHLLTAASHSHDPSIEKVKSDLKLLPVTFLSQMYARYLNLYPFDVDVKTKSILYARGIDFKASLIRELPALYEDDDLSE
jgi:hypothetical protein